VRWGEQTYDEMMVGFFDVGVPAGVDKQHFFIRKEATIASSLQRAAPMDRRRAFGAGAAVLFAI